MLRDVYAGFRRLSAAAAFVLLWLVLGWTPASAHEFWMMPSAFEAGASAPVTVELYVGQYFEGDAVPLSAQYVSDFADYSSAGQRVVRQSLTAALPASGNGGIPMHFADAGTHLLALDTHPNRVALSADRFNDYLRDEGLDDIVRLREATGKTGEPSRERYRRHIKTLIDVGGKSDDTPLQSTGQVLEILPSQNPLRKQAGDSIRFQLLFQGKPLAHALLKAWQRQGQPKPEQTLMIRARSDAQGMLSITFPFAGTWMLSTVHMLPVSGDGDLDWDSYWGNLTFGLRAQEK